MLISLNYQYEMWLHLGLTSLFSDLQSNGAVVHGYKSVL